MYLQRLFSFSVLEIHPGIPLTLGTDSYHRATHSTLTLPFPLRQGLTELLKLALTTHIQNSEDNVGESVLSFHSVPASGQTESTRLAKASTFTAGPSGQPLWIVSGDPKHAS